MALLRGDNGFFINLDHITEIRPIRDSSDRVAIYLLYISGVERLISKTNVSLTGSYSQIDLIINEGMYVAISEHLSTIH